MLRNNARKIAFFSCALGLGLFLVTLFIAREDLMLEWHRIGVRRGLLDPEFKARDLPEAWRDLFATGEAASRALARLLRDDDYRVWAGTAYLIDHEMDDRAREAFVANLRAMDQEGLLRYLIFEAYSTTTEWRNDGTLAANNVSTNGVHLGPPRADWEDYWIGHPEGTLVPTAAGRRFLEQILTGKMHYSGDPRCYWRFKFRAITALSLMLPPGELRRLPQVDDQADDEAQKVLALLSRAAVQEDPDLRLHAINRLAQRSGICKAKILPELPEWSSFAFWGDVPTDAYMAQAFEDPGAYAALMHLDSPWALEVLVRLYERLPTREMIERVLADSRLRLPLPLPSWLPFTDSARRWLKGNGAERLLAALCLADLDDRESAAALRQLLGEEQDAGARLVYTSCLAALGDGKQDVTAMASELRSRVLNPGHGSELVGMGFRGKSTNVFPFSEKSLDLGDRQERVYINYWARPDDLWDVQAVEDPNYLATGILRSGDIKGLAEIVGLLRDVPRPSWQKAAKNVILGWVRLDYLVEGFPVHPADVFKRRPDLAEAFDPEGFKEAQVRLATWWAEEKDRLVWNPAQRMFVVKR